MYSSTSTLLSVIIVTTTKPPTAGSHTFSMTAYVAGAITGLVDMRCSYNPHQIILFNLWDGTTSGTTTVPASHYSSRCFSYCYSNSN